jgi:3-hydroxyisobutyrate dehydrogenase
VLWPDPATPFEATADELAKLVADPKIRHVVCSPRRRTNIRQRLKEKAMTTYGSSPDGQHAAAAAPGGGRGPRVAVLGTGMMGAAMAGNLLRAGLQTDVWNRTPEPAARLTEIGAVAHASPELAVRAADIVITMLPDADAVRSVVLDEDVLNAFTDGAVWAQMGTIGINPTLELSAQVRRHRPDVRFVDAPVSGTRGPAEAGQLLILGSGPENARETVTPVFGAIGSRTLWLGEAGAGSRLKLVLNTWLAFLVEGIAESAALADVLGVDHGALLESLDGSPLAAPAAVAKLRKISAGDDSPDFSLRWALKDIDLAVGAAGADAAPVASAISRRWQQLVAEGFGDLDVSAVRHGLAEAGSAR